MRMRADISIECDFVINSAFEGRWEGTSSLGSMKNRGRRLGAVAVTVGAGLVAALGTGVADASAWPGSGSPGSASPGQVQQAGMTGTAAVRVPVLSWRSCHGGWQCATAPVPLDYRHPGGRKISIAVVRHLATDPARRLGSLFINGGGPAEQIEPLMSFYPSLPAVLRERYDIVFFDPRGFGFSTAVRCFPSATAEQKFLGPLPLFPVGAKQDTQWERTYARFDARCAKTNGRLLVHDTSTDVARDMNLLRAGVHDPVLNYLGVSYGTGLGAIYANLFPSRVGRMILDANLDPARWTGPDRSRPDALREGIDEANAAGMTAFLSLCGRATRAACAFSAGTPAATRAKWTTLLRRLRVHPVTIGRPPQTFTYAGAFEVPDLGDVSSWQQAAAALQQLWAASASGPARTASRPATAPVYTGLEQQLAVYCSDVTDPRNPSAYPAAARLAYARSGGWGTAEVWGDERCAQWPGNRTRDRYTGPWNRRTANPVLVVGITGDSQLPYRDDVAMEHDLARARLLTVRGYGHTELGNPSTCATKYELSYLQTGALPPPGTICQQNATPFPAP
jgi:pimeloyl-ACP methyl ester carboxylesterase